MDISKLASNKNYAQNVENAQAIMWANLDEHLHAHNRQTALKISMRFNDYLCESTEKMCLIISKGFPSETLHYFSRSKRLSNIDANMCVQFGGTLGADVLMVGMCVYYSCELNGFLGGNLLNVT